MQPYLTTKILHVALCLIERPIKNKIVYYSRSSRKHPLPDPAAPVIP